MDFDTSLQTARRASAGTSALGWIALLCLILNAAFWASLMLDLLAPRTVFSPQSLQAALATVAFALILPLFWSMLLPSSPAGRLLQKQTWALPGQLAVTFAAVFLTWLAGQWLRAWWQGQPNVVEAGADLLLTVSSLIAGVLVPALAWCVTTPEQWIAQIEQARHVRRLEHAMKMEEAAMRAAYARGVALLNADLTNLTLEQKRELAGILGGFARMQERSMRQIAASWKDMFNVEAVLTSTPDTQLLASYKEVAGLLTEGANAFGESATYATLVGPSAAHQDTVDRVRPNDAERPNATVHRTTSGPAADHRTTERPTERPTDRAHEQAFETARRALSGAWKRRDLEEALSISKTQAHDYITAWLASGDLAKLTEPRDHYEWRD